MQVKVELIEQAARAILSAKRVVAFTGAGISVESGIPPFRGKGGLWTQYDPNCLDILSFQANPERAWGDIKKIFYDFFGEAKPNAAHTTLAKMEVAGLLHRVITQNIDALHQAAGSLVVTEYHGSSHRLVCPKCLNSFPLTAATFEQMPPRCNNCNNILKPDFVFFGEPIPEKAHLEAMRETIAADVWIVIGTTGEVYPACSLPRIASRNRKTIIEINTNPSLFTTEITDIFLQGKATTMMSLLWQDLSSGKGSHAN